VSIKGIRKKTLLNAFLNPKRMKNQVYGMLIACISICYGCQPVESGHPEDVIKADGELNRYFLEGNAEKAADYYLDDFVLITSTGKLKKKTDVLTEVADPELVMQINEMQNPLVRVHGKTAVLTGTLHQKYTWKGKEYDVYVLVTDTWVLTEQGWKILSGQALLVNRDQP
jgi:hypothetical protein